MKNLESPRNLNCAITLRPIAAATATAALVLLAAFTPGQPAYAQNVDSVAATPMAVDRAAPGPATAAAGSLRQEPKAAAQEEEGLESVTSWRWQVGEGTQRLLAMQRSGDLASPVPRPVPGEVAQRSRERWLKSFEREIPEHFRSSVGGSKQGSGN